MSIVMDFRKHFNSHHIYLHPYKVVQMVKNLLQYRRHRFISWIRKIPWRRAWPPTPVFLPGEPHGQRSLAGIGMEGPSHVPTTLPFLLHALAKRTI